MKYFKYFIEFLLTIISFVMFKVLGADLSSKFCGKIFQIIGPFFRPRKIIHSNIIRAFPNIDKNNLQQTGKNKDILDLGDFTNKWKSFGWNTYEVDGHNINDLLK